MDYVPKPMEFMCQQVAVGTAQDRSRAALPGSLLDGGPNRDAVRSLQHPKSVRGDRFCITVRFAPARFSICQRHACLDLYMYRVSADCGSNFQASGRSLPRGGDEPRRNIYRVER